VEHIIDFASQEVPLGQMSLMLDLTPRSEILLTSVFLNIARPNVIVEFHGTIGWEARLSLLPAVPEIIFRIRRGGFTKHHTLIFQTTDSLYTGSGVLIPVMTADIATSFQFAAFPDAPDILGTYQHYHLTAEFVGSGEAAIIGPVTLIGRVIG